MRLTTYPPIREGLNLGDLLKFEADNLYSRDRVIVSGHQTLAFGQVVGRFTANGHIAVLNPAATDGSEHAVGVAIAPITTGEAPDPDGLIVARHAVVADHALVWIAGITPDQQAIATEQLRNMGIIVRQGV